MTNNQQNKLKDKIQKLINELEEAKETKSKSERDLTEHIFNIKDKVQELYDYYLKI